MSGKSHIVFCHFCIRIGNVDMTAQRVAALPAEDSSDALMNPEIDLRRRICSNPHSSCAEINIRTERPDIIFFSVYIAFRNLSGKLSKYGGNSIRAYGIFLFRRSEPVEILVKKTDNSFNVILTIMLVHHKAGQIDNSLFSCIIWI